MEQPSEMAILSAEKKALDSKCLDEIKENIQLRTQLNLATEKLRSIHAQLISTQKALQIFEEEAANDALPDEDPEPEAA